MTSKNLRLTTPFSIINDVVCKSQALVFSKNGFLTLVLLSAVFMVCSIVQMNRIRDDSEYYHDPEQVLGAPFRDLDPNFAECVTDPSKIFCLVSANERLNMIDKKQNPAPILRLEGRAKRKHPIHSLLEDFCQVAQSLGATPILIEPSILFCMVSEAQKLLLLRRGLNLTMIKGSELVVTLAVAGNDVDLLNQEDAIAAFKSANFEPFIVQDPVAEWMEAWARANISTHLFYKRGQLLVHVVVFYERSNYLWHAALRKSEIHLQEFEDLVFIKADSAYESFNPHLLNNESLVSIHIPSNPQYFLFEIAASRFLECNLSRGAHLPAASGRKLERFRRQTVSAIRELKFRLSGPLLRFWMFSGTLLVRAITGRDHALHLCRKDKPICVINHKDVDLHRTFFEDVWTPINLRLEGWYRQCDVIPYTSDVDLAAWISDLNNFEDISKHLYDNKHLKLDERMGIMEEGLEYRLDSHGLRVDLFFVYQDSNRTWIAVHKPSQNWFMRMYYPRFSICSADLLGEKVHAPCEPEEIISTEYGPDWQLPISEWSYHKSPFNMDKKQFWNESQKTEVYKTYK